MANKGEANRQCYLQKKKQENSDCWLCAYESNCWKNENSVCEDCMIQIEGADYGEGKSND